VGKEGGDFLEEGLTVYAQEFIKADGGGWGTARKRKVSGGPVGEGRVI